MKARPFQRGERFLAPADVRSGRTQIEKISGTSGKFRHVLTVACDSPVLIHACPGRYRPDSRRHVCWFEVTDVDACVRSIDIRRHR